MNKIIILLGISIFTLIFHACYQGTRSCDAYPKIQNAPHLPQPFRYSNEYKIEITSDIGIDTLLFTKTIDEEYFVHETYREIEDQCKSILKHIRKVNFVSSQNDVLEVITQSSAPEIFPDPYYKIYTPALKIIFNEEAFYFNFQIGYGAPPANAIIKPFSQTSTGGEEVLYSSEKGILEINLPSINTYLKMLP